MTLLRAAALGLATGSRSQIGVAALAVTQPATARPHGVLRLISGERRRLGFPVAAAGELVGDKLPKTPSRLTPPGLVARVVLGGLGGAIIAARAEDPPWAAVAVGVAAATLSSVVGARWRGWATRRFGRDLPGALLEDAAAISLAAVAARPVG